MPGELAQLGSKSAIPCALVRHGGTIAVPTAVAPQLAAHGRGCTTKPRRNRAQRHAGRNAPRDLLPFIHAEHAPRALPRRWPDPAMRLEMRKDRSRRPVEHAADQLQPFTPLPTIPNL